MMVLAYKQKGVALVVVLLVVALVSMIATEMSGRLQYEIRRSGNIFDKQQARSYALGAEKFAVTILQQDIKDNPKRKDLEQAWATQGIYFPVQGGDLTGVITDANRCFNLNSLVSTNKQTSGLSGNNQSTAYIAYRRLLTLLSLPVELSDSLVDWIDSDEYTFSSDGAEDLEYQSLDPAYRAANDLLVDVSELRLIQGYTNDVVTKLRPYVCALPQAGYLQLNINTLDVDKPELLAMISSKLDINEAKAALDARSPSGYDNIDDFWQLQAFAGLKIDSKQKDLLQMNSNYFVFKAKARIGRGHEALTTLFKEDSNAKVRVIWRRFGIFE